MLSHIPSSSGLSRNENGRLCHEHLAGGLRGLVGGVVRGEIWQHIYPKNHYSVLRDQSPNFRVAALNKERKNPFMDSILCYKLHERQLMEGFGFREFTQRTTIIIAVEVLQHNCHNCQGASCKFLRPHLYSWIRPTLEFQVVKTFEPLFELAFLSRVFLSRNDMYVRQDMLLSAKWELWLLTESGRSTSSSSIILRAGRRVSFPRSCQLLHSLSFSVSSGNRESRVDIDYWEREKEKRGRNIGAMAYLGKHPIRHQGRDSELQASRCQHVRKVHYYYYNSLHNIFIGT